MKPARPLAPPHIAAIAPYQPGKPISELRRELGEAWPAQGAVKLASNENPWGPSPKALEALAIAAVESSRYPDGGTFALRERLALELGVGSGQLFIGSGSNDIINLVVQAFCADGDEVLTPRQQFLCYRLAAEAFGRPLRECDNGPGFALSADAILAAVTPATKVVFLANPNNPTGTYLPKGELARLVRDLPQDIVFAVDEAYVEYVDAADYGDGLPLLGARERLLLMRTFSKIHGLAGLRVGYAITQPALVELLNRVRLPFNVSSLGQVAATAALDDVEHVERARRENRLQRARVSEELLRRGFAVTPSQGNFVLCEVPRPYTGPTLYDALLRKGVIVRPLMPYALPGHLRISIGTPDENQRLFAELDEVLRGSR